MSLIESPKTDPQEYFRALEREKFEFRIRGHHLKFFHRVWNRQLSPKNIAEDIVCSVLFSKETYRRDVAGKTPEEYKATEERMAVFFKRYDSLSLDYPIEIVQTGDGICNSCHIGNHCLERNQIESDAEYIQAVLNAVEFLNKTEEKALPLPEICNLGPLRILKTSKNVLYKIFRVCDFSEKSIDWLKNQIRPPQPV